MYLGEMVGVPSVGHYWADLQSVHGFRCCDNIAPYAKCQRVLVLALCLVSSSRNLSFAELKGGKIPTKTAVGTD